MNPMLLQKQLKDNAKDLNEFFEDLKSWGQEMKTKEEERQNPANTGNSSKQTEKKRIRGSVEEKKKKNQTETIPSKPRYTDYSAWETFDAEAECEKIDHNENDESELTDECDEMARDEAYLEKEKGNRFVKEKNWDEAIKCYTKAIDLYAYDAVFYANRALCFLKKENHTKAEVDCVMSLKLDSSYVKAYQRRAAAREALGKLEEAEADLLRVLDLEPSNKESSAKLAALRDKLRSGRKIEENVQRPVSRFTASRSRNKNYGISATNNRLYQTTSNNNNNNNNKNPEQYIFVKSVNKPKHLQSTTPLKRIDIQEVMEVDNTDDKTELPVPSPQSQPSLATRTLKTDDLKIIEKQMPTKTTEAIKQNKNLMNNLKMREEAVAALSCPKNFIQFSLHWKSLNTIDDKFAYLNTIGPENLPKIFGESLESNIFSEIIEVLAEHSSKNNVDVYALLVFLSEMKRFSTMVMFMTAKDRTRLRSLLARVEQSGERPEEEVKQLLKMYDLVH